ncbi:MAG: hypothetical protein J5I90_05940 [Caldilineales bacterium]|nr:hypothetical protein [Caldilineales bacterium]
MQRPIGVTILAVFSGVLALLALIASLQWLGFLGWMSSAPPNIVTPNIWNFFIYALLVWVYVWLTQMLLQVDPAAWMFMMVITIFNLTLNFVSFLNGVPPELLAASTVINALILIYAVLPGTRKAFGQK